MPAVSDPVHPAAMTCRDLNDSRRRQLQLLRDLRVFKLRNQIERSAKDEQSAWHHYGLVLVIMLVESTINAYFFAKGNEFGYLGGIVQAMLISLVNVGVAVAVGKFWLPQINHISSNNKLIGFLAIPVHLCFALFFNLLAAHYRDAYSRGTDEALMGSVQALLSAPFNLSFEGFMMFMTGLVASGLGLWKGLTEDDPYPGFGALTRQYQRARHEFVEMRRQLPECEYDQPELGDDT